MPTLRCSAVGAALLSSLIFGLAAGQASAAGPACGSVIATDTTLTADVGPCDQGGLVIGADNITLDLGGHIVRGKPRTGDGLGVSTNGHSGARITNGTVRDFD